MCEQYSPAAVRRMAIGENSLLGDARWGGLFGIDADFIAIEDVKVLPRSNILPAIFLLFYPPFALLFSPRIISILLYAARKWGLIAMPFFLSCRCTYEIHGYFLLCVCLLIYSCVYFSDCLGFRLSALPCRRTTSTMLMFRCATASVPFSVQQDSLPYSCQCVRHQRREKIHQ